MAIYSLWTSMSGERVKYTLLSYTYSERNSLRVKGLNILTLWSYSVRVLACGANGLNILTSWSYTVRGLA